LDSQHGVKLKIKMSLVLFESSLKMFNLKNKSRSEFIICLLLVAIILAAYWQLPTHDFLNLDDNGYITKNAHVKEGVIWENIAWAFNFVKFAYWHPITWIFHMFFYQLFGMNPAMHHLMNLFLHIANSLLLYFVFKRMTGANWESAFIAALFAIHPINVESVAWISELKNVLSTFFWILSMLLYARYAKRPGFYRYLITVFVFIVGLMAKPMLVTLPFVLLLLDYWPLNRFKFSQSKHVPNDSNQSTLYEFQFSQNLRLILEKVPFLFLSAVCLYLSSLSMQRPGVLISTALVPIKLRIANALISYVAYIKKMFWPHHLGVFYPFPKTIPLWQVAGAGLFLIFITFWVIRWIGKKPYLAVGWLWYIGTLIPVIGLVQAGLWPATADRFAYLPLIGLFIIIAWGIPDLMGGWHYKKLIIASIAMVLILNFTVATRLQNRYWTNNISLYKHALAVTDNNAIAHQKLGEALSSKGKTVEAAKHYNKALQINSCLIGANLNLGLILKEEGKFDKAIERFSKVIRIRPDYADAYYEIAATMEKQGNIDGAVKYYLEALRLKPEAARIHNNLGIALAYQNKEKEAIFHFSEALRIDSNYAVAHYNLGKIYINQQDFDRAIFQFKKSLQLNPNMAEALYNLSMILASHKEEKYRNGDKALELAQRLCEITGNIQPLAYDALSAAYAETGNFDAALFNAQKGLQLALKQGSDELISGLKERLQIYKAKKPFRKKF
jgi:tetratricopeptide (TPR) repeat protein